MCRLALQPVPHLSVSHSLLLAHPDHCRLQFICRIRACNDSEKKRRDFLKIEWRNHERETPEVSRGTWRHAPSPQIKILVEICAF